MLMKRWMFVSLAAISALGVALALAATSASHDSSTSGQDSQFNLTQTAEATPESTPPACEPGEVLVTKTNNDGTTEFECEDVAESDVEATPAAAVPDTTPPACPAGEVLVQEMEDGQLKSDCEDVNNTEDENGSDDDGGDSHVQANRLGGDHEDAGHGSQHHGGADD